jgi:hypothetical protein
MFLSISSPLIHDLLARLAADARSEPFLLAIFGVSLILMGKLVHWLGLRNRAEIIHGPNKSEMTRTEAVLPGRVGADSFPLPLGSDRPLGPAAALLTTQSWNPSERASDLNLALRYNSPPPYSKLQ